MHFYSALLVVAAFDLVVVGPSLAGIHILHKEFFDLFLTFLLCLLLFDKYLEKISTQCRRFSPITFRLLLDPGILDFASPATVISVCGFTKRVKGTMNEQGCVKW